MTTYLIQAAYSTSAVAAMVKNPQDRAAIVRTMTEKAGGKMHDFWFALGEYDIVAVVEVPDNVSAAAFSMAISASGTMSAYKTTPLLSAEEGVQAMKQAGGISFQAPK